MMTVERLIKALQGQDPKALVGFHDGAGAYLPVESVGVAEGLSLPVPSRIRFKLPLRDADRPTSIVTLWD